MPDFTNLTDPADFADAAQRTVLPLFPLGQAVFPGVNTKLRIFEQRYLRLVRESVRNQTPFAMVPIIRGLEVGEAPEFYPWGTLVTITDWDQQQDGLLEITICGDRRVRVYGNQVKDDGLIVAEMDILAMDPQVNSGDEHRDLQQLLEELEAGLRIKDLFVDQPLDLATLGWRLATLLPLSLKTKMAVLGEADSYIRLEIIREGIARLVEGLDGGD
ncbi:MAG: LON peptidase substrate-binding domain-containing protein [Porticoccaceae bacterium]